MRERNVKSALTKKEKWKTENYGLDGLWNDFWVAECKYGQGGTKLVTGDFLNDSFECQIIYIQN